jgi:hypothetical protein
VRDCGSTTDVALRQRASHAVVTLGGARPGWPDPPATSYPLSEDLLHQLVQQGNPFCTRATGPATKLHLQEELVALEGGDLGGVLASGVAAVHAVLLHSCALVRASSAQTSSMSR